MSKRASPASSFFTPKKHKSENSNVNPTASSDGGFALLDSSLIYYYRSTAEAGSADPPPATASPTRVSVASFDLDHTLTTPKSGGLFVQSGSDWRWLDQKMPSVLRKLAAGTCRVDTNKPEKSESGPGKFENQINQIAEKQVVRSIQVENRINETDQTRITNEPMQNENQANDPIESGNETSTQSKTAYEDVQDGINNTKYVVVIFTNQGGVVPKIGTKRFAWYKERIKQMADELQIDLRVYAACRPLSKGSNDIYRKPLTGMWTRLTKHLSDLNMQVDMSTSFYVGDAAGRPQDHSDSDKGFAEAVGVKFYTPEEFFGLPHSTIAG